MDSTRILQKATQFFTPVAVLTLSSHCRFTYHVRHVEPLNQHREGEGFTRQIRQQTPGVEQGSLVDQEIPTGKLTLTSLQIQWFQEPLELLCGDGFFEELIGRKREMREVFTRTLQPGSSITCIFTGNLSDFSRHFQIIERTTMTKNKHFCLPFFART